MDEVTKVTLVGATVCGAFGIGRMLISIASTAWWSARYREVDALETFDHQMFHDIQSRRQPWYVRLNTWLEVRHV